MMKNMLMNTLQKLNPVPLIRSQKFVCGYWDWKKVLIGALALWISEDLSWLIIRRELYRALYSSTCLPKADSWQKIGKTFTNLCRKENRSAEGEDYIKWPLRRKGRRKSKAFEDQTLVPGQTERSVIEPLSEFSCRIFRRKIRKQRCELG